MFIFNWVIILSSLITSAFAVELNSSILILNQADLNNCPTQLQKVVSLGNRRVNIIPTFYLELDKDNKAKSYWFRDIHAQPIPLSHSITRDYQNKLSICIKKANDLNLSPTVTVHLDDLKQRIWRRKINFSPLQRYKNFSFKEAILDQTYQSLLFSKFSPELYLTGEMDLSFARYTAQYYKIASGYKKDVKIGVSFNFNRVFKAPSINMEMPFDMVGISNYLPVPSSCSKDSFKKHIKKIKKQLKKVGLDHLPLNFNEIGLGGFSKRMPAILITIFPHKGVSGKQNIETDPWTSTSKREIRYKYHKCLLSFLKETNDIKSAFLWNLDSWDVQGLYHYSTGYKDSKIQDLIYRHNSTQ